MATLKDDREGDGIMWDIFLIQFYHRQALQEIEKEALQERGKTGHSEHLPLCFFQNISVFSTVKRSLNGIRDCLLDAVESSSCKGTHSLDT